MRQTILDQIKTICTRHKIDALYVFGSRAKEIAEYVLGEGTIITDSRSDVDIGILPSKGHRLDVKDKVNLAVELEDLLGVGRVDLIVAPEVSPFLALDVIGGELLYSTDLDRSSEYELYVMRKAGDLAYFERQRREYILRGQDL